MQTNNKPKVLPVFPDRELQNWEKWIRIRKEDTEKLGQLTNRPPADLAMNLLEGIREDKERKIVLEDAKIEKKPEVRGNLWEQPLRLKQQCYCQPAYEVQRTSVEMGKPKVIEHIGVPRLIQNTEQGITGVPERKKCSLLDADYVKYRDKREHDLQEAIVKIDPYRSQVAELVIKGSPPKPPPKKMPPVPSIYFSTENAQAHNLESIYSLRINNTVIFKDLPGQKLTHLIKMQQELWHEQCTSWTYYFNVPVNKAGRNKLYLKNLGTVTLRFCWKKIKRPIPFIPEDVYEQVFFFCKNEDVLPPGQEKEIHFTFLTNKPGIYSEYWEFSLCNICFFDNLADKLTITLYADAIEDIDKIKRDVEDLRKSIYEQSVKNLVNELIDDAVAKATSIEPHIYPYKKMLLEAELFVMKNPVCFYHQTEVMKMRELYAAMNSKETWDLSIGSWRQAMINETYDDRMKYYELLRKSHRDFLKPWYEGDDLTYAKQRTINLLFGQLAELFDKEYVRIVALHYPPEIFENEYSKSRQKLSSLSSISPLIKDTVRNVFFIQMYEHVTSTIETCAGILSSLELNRWIDFDFCRT